MINIAELVYDPDFTQDFTVHRKTGSWSAGRFVETESSLTFAGVITPASAKEILQFPEGDRVTGMMKFYSEQEMHVTHNSGTPGTSDQIEWRGQRYRVINVTPYSDYGYYKAFGVYLESD